jgi:hypothetical protein
MDCSYFPIDYLKLSKEFTKGKTYRTKTAKAAPIKMKAKVSTKANPRVA